MEKGKFLISRLGFNVLHHCAQRKGQCWAAAECMFGSRTYFPSPAGSTGEGLQFAEFGFMTVFMEGSGSKGLPVAISALGKTKEGL